MQIGVAYAEPDQQLWLSLEVAEGSTVEDAILQSGILNRFPAIDLDKHKVGVFGKITKLSGPLNEGDRIEIYRPITVDPKTVPQRKFDADDDDDNDDDND
jgi:putative ubiquitin-RnfH superfamily antitoxin RatB of RatAB toxin-antitoxin module